MIHSPDTILREARHRKLAGEWALVLASEGLPVRVCRRHEVYTVEVPAEDAAEAIRILEDYDAENPHEPARPKLKSQPGQVETGLGVALSLLLFFSYTGPRDSSVIWFERGSASAERILTGEPWRAVTALTLHADLGHVAGNAAIGAFFIGAVAGIVGPGLACALVLFAGIGGNGLNALLHGSLHSSVGASTSLFGAVGILGGIAAVRRRAVGVRGRQALVPVAAGLGVIAMLGTGGRADVWAHLFGFLTGGALGAATILLPKSVPGIRAQWGFGLGSAAIVLAAWHRALS